MFSHIERVFIIEEILSKFDFKLLHPVTNR